ncbi:MAG: sulfite exporter TauE/SafE family protein [Chitinophagaceae bacterium]
MLPILIAGFTLGFAGSLHCVSMCGPLSLALPTHHLSAGYKLLSLFAYQCGRVFTYSIMGLLFGLAGRTLYITGLQQWFSIVLGMMVLVLAFLSFSNQAASRLSFLNKIYARVAKLINNLLRKRSGPFGFLLLGAANGLLPCGMVYMALAASLSFYKVYQSIAFMAMFGAGTLPAMMLVGYSAQFISPQLRNGFKKAVPFVITLTGILLILRGMQLGIPYISPQLPAAASAVIDCHP